MQNIAKKDNPIINLTKCEMQAVNNLIIANMKSQIAIVPQIADYIISAGGKRLRPMLLVACYKLMEKHFGKINEADKNQPTNHCALYGACIEFIHTATLVHDDVVDESLLRRGEKTANTVWGNQVVVLVGDFLFSRAFYLMASANKRATKVLANASVTLAEGEIMQLLTTNNLDTKVDEYLKMIECKTAVLFSAACKVGSVLFSENNNFKAEQTQNLIDNLENFGKYLGIAFQLTDDLLDYVGKPSNLGKDVGDDFKEGKITLPLLIVLQLATEKELKFLDKTIKNRNQQNGDFEIMIRLIEKYNAVELTEKEAMKYAEKATDELKQFKDSEMKTALEITAKMAIDRIK